MNTRRILVAVASLALVLGGGYLAYQWYYGGLLPEPESSLEEPQLTEEQRQELDVTLPEELQQDLERNQQRQRDLFGEAVNAQSQGDYDRAVDRYRRVLSYSGKDTIAARSYQYLGDIYSRNNSYDQAIRLYQFGLDIQSRHPELHYRLGLTYREKGNVPEAETALDRAIEYGERSEYYLARGNLHYDQSEYEDAESLYVSGITAGSNLGALYTNLALARERQGDTEGAIDAYSRALRQTLEDALRHEVHLNKGKLHVQLEQYTQAISEFETARDLDDTSEAYYNLGLARAEAGNRIGALDALEAALERAPDDADIMKDIATIYQQMEDYEQAIEYYERALQERPESTDVMIALGRLHEKRNENEAALRYYQQIVEMEDRGPELKLTFRRVGELYLNMGEPENAQPAFRNVLSMDTASAETHYNLGIAYRRSGDMEKAIEEFRRARDLKKESVHYQLVLADSLYRAGFLDDARDAYRRVNELDPERNDADYMIGYLHYRRGDLDEARRKFQSLIEQLEDQTLLVKTYQNLGNIYLRNEDLTRAEASYRQALGIRKSAQTYFNLGLVYSRQENWEVASTTFRNALERDGENPTYQAALGLVLSKRGLYEEAKSHLDDALAADPADLRGQYNLQQLKQTLEEINAEVAGS